MATITMQGVTVHNLFKRRADITLAPHEKPGYAYFTLKSLAYVMGGDYIIKRSEDDTCDTLWKIVTSKPRGQDLYGGEMFDMFAENVPSGGINHRVKRVIAASHRYGSHGHQLD